MVKAMMGPVAVRVNHGKMLAHGRVENGMTCRCRVAMYWNLDDGLAERRSPTTMYGVDWRDCDLHRQPGSAGYAIGDADTLRSLAEDHGGVFTNVLVEAAAMAYPFPSTLRVYNDDLRRREAVREWKASG